MRGESMTVVPDTLLLRVAIYSGEVEEYIIFAACCFDEAI
jgi:hypothetical protein